MSTFGKFFDTIQASDHFKGQMWMDGWIGLVDVNSWKKVRNTLLTENLVICFVKDMLGYFQQRIQSICTDALYASTLKRGYAF